MLSMAQDDRILAKDYYQNGKFKKALLIYKKLQIASSSNSDYNLKIIECHQQLNQFNSAQDHIESQMLGSKHPQYLVELGYNYQLQNKPEQALLNYNQALLLTEQKPQYMYGVAKRFEAHSLLDQAIEVYEIGLLRSSNPNYYYQLAGLYAAKQNIDELNILVDYTINRHYPEIKSSKNKALDLLNLVMEKQCQLVINWMRVGFIHGVMNTDNMTISGETIDYGPCAFMDTFAPDTVFSSIDHKGRYAYANQPYIAQWNIARLAESLLPLIEGNKEETIAMAEDVLNSFEQVYKKRWLSMMRSKLGLALAEKEDEKLITDLLDWMHASQSDYTNTFRNLSNSTLISGELYASKNFQNWHSRWQDRLEKEEQDRESSIAQMRSVNPSVIPRNHKVEEALQAGEQSDFKPFHDLINAMNEPYEEGEHLLPYQAPPQPGEKVLQTFCGT